ncbi:MAG: nitroreductase [Thermoprotei archaeon]|nr:MAG: nitroreductase [Thermoprotei archaeon]
MRNDSCVLHISTVGGMGKEEETAPPTSAIGEYYLPLSKLKGTMSVEEAIARRRSVREYLSEPLSIEELAQLLWAAQGITDPKRGSRAAPSASATYPLEVYVVVGKNGVKELSAGIYKYNPLKHSIKLIKQGDYRADLAKAALSQPWVNKAPVVMVITAVYERTTSRYGERGIRYVHMEAGHVGQNIYLQTTALGMGTVVVGAFYDDMVREIIEAPKKEHPLYLIPIGKVAKLHELSAEELAEYYEKNRRG